MSYHHGMHEIANSQTAGSPPRSSGCVRIGWYANRVRSLPADCRLLVGLVLGVATLTGPSPALAGVFAGRPDVLVCSVDDPIDVQPWNQLVFYVSARLEDGNVLYKSLTSNPVLVTVSVEGRVSAKNLADCDGKTVAQLRDAGRAFDFER